MAIANPTFRATSKEQKLLFIFTFNLVKAADHLQSTRLLRFLEHEGVLQSDQIKEIKAQGTPAGRTLVLLDNVIKRCESNSGIFKKFRDVVEDKQPSVWKDHMPNTDMEEKALSRLYGQVKDKGNPFKPENFSGIFGLYNPYITSREIPKSLKMPDQPVMVEPKFEEKPPPTGLKVLWITEKNDQHTAVLSILEKHCTHSNCGSLTTGQSFSYYSFSGEDGEPINFFIVPGSDTGRDLSDTSSLYSYSMNWQPWAIDLSIILLTGHCWAVENSKKDPKLGDICVIKEAISTKEGEQDAKTPAAAKFTVVEHVCREMGVDKSGRWRWQSKKAVNTERPEKSYKWQALWLTRLHHEICKVTEDKDRVYIMALACMFILKWKNTHLYQCLFTCLETIKVVIRNKIQLSPLY
jgi:hypothetical protein